MSSLSNCVVLRQVRQPGLRCSTEFLRSVCVAVLILMLPASSGADDFSWNAGNGLWHNANHWTPNGVPGAAGFSDVIRIGDLPGIQNSTVTLGAPGASYES